VAPAALRRDRDTVREAQHISAEYGAAQQRSCCAVGWRKEGFFCLERGACRIKSFIAG
jgi:hypothetical protein